MKKSKKKKVGIARLLEISKSKQSLFNLAKMFTMFTTLIKLLQMWLVYKIISEVSVSILNSSHLNTDNIKKYALILIISGVFYALIRFVSSKLAHKGAFEIIYNTKISLINHLNKIHLGYLNELSLGKLEKIIMADAEKIEAFLSHHQMDMIEISLTAPLVIIYLFFIDITLALAVVIPILIAIPVLALHMAKPENKEYQVILNDENENVQSEVIEYIKGMNDIKCYDIGKKSMSEYKKAVNSLSDIIIKIANTSKHYVSLFYAILNLPYLAVIMVTYFRYFSSANKVELVSELVLFLIAITVLKSNFEMLFVISSSQKEINESVSRIDSILDIPEIKEPAFPERLEKYDIEFSNVFFSYGDKEILNDISFKLEQRQKLGIVGSSGGGKTTIAKLVIKFLKANSGEIKIGGVNIDDIDNKTLMENISFVFQENYLFKDTIRFNLSMNKNIPEDKITEICKKLNIHNKIMTLENGYDSVVGEGDGFFSGGEIQRIAVARILLKDSKIIVLDEATSAADTENEIYMQKAFLELAHDKTVLIIAHRLKTVENVDKIIVIEDGKLIENGTHEELLANKGRYYKLYEYQNLSETISISESQKGEVLC